MFIELNCYHWYKLEDWVKQTTASLTGWKMILFLGHWAKMLKTCAVFWALLLFAQFLVLQTGEGTIDPDEKSVRFFQIGLNNLIPKSQRLWSYFFVEVKEVGTIAKASF